MLNELATTCDGQGCDRPLTADECMLVYETPGGERHAYECDCGAVTVTVIR